MHWIKYVIRGLLLLLLILQAIHLNNKTDNALGKIVKFKMETLNHVKADSLDAERKVDFMVDETAKFTKDIAKESPYIRTGMSRLIGLLAIFIVVELALFILQKRKKNAD